MNEELKQRILEHIESVEFEGKLIYDSRFATENESSLAKLLLEVTAGIRLMIVALEHG